MRTSPGGVVLPSKGFGWAFKMKADHSGTHLITLLLILAIKWIGAVNTCLSVWLVCPVWCVSWIDSCNYEATGKVSGIIK